MVLSKEFLLEMVKGMEPRELMQLKELIDAQMDSACQAYISKWYLNEDEKALAREGKSINAIKAHRARTGSSLLEAKNLVWKFLGRT